MRGLATPLCLLAVLVQLAAGGLGASALLCVEADGQATLEAFCACASPCTCEADTACDSGNARDTGVGAERRCGPCRDVQLTSPGDREALPQARPSAACDPCVKALNADAPACVALHPPASVFPAPAVARGSPTRLTTACLPLRC
ncbi:MAG: hypothetical protein HYZ53_21800 [Planctomycetes bacterium]|nr:hypothetical protein [Planctomycetota bacterium]